MDDFRFLSMYYNGLLGSLVSMDEVGLGWVGVGRRFGLDWLIWID